MPRLAASVQARDAAVAVPARVQRIEEFLKQLEMGDVKLRVRVLEVSYDT